MKVLFVSTFFSPHGGGLELVVERLAREFASRGHRVEWAASDLRRSRPPDLPGVICHPMEARDPMEGWLGLPYPVWSRGSTAMLARAVRDAEIVNAHDGFYWTTRRAQALAREAGRPLVITQHTAEIPFPSPILDLASRALTRFVTAPALRCADAVVCVSERPRRYYRRTLPQEVATILNGVDPLLFFPAEDKRRYVRERLGLPERNLVFLYVGRFTSRKGLSALRRGAAARPDVQFVTIGGGPVDPASWGLPNVRNVGPLAHTEVPDWYRSADLLVLPSRGEGGFPLAVQEALACGTPALVSDEVLEAFPAGRGELLLAGRHGMDFPSACGRAASDRVELARRRESAAKLAASLWTWKKTADEYEALFGRLLSRPTRRSRR